MRVLYEGRVGGVEKSAFAPDRDFHSDEIEFLRNMLAGVLRQAALLRGCGNDGDKSRVVSSEVVNMLSIVLSVECYLFEGNKPPRSEAKCKTLADDCWHRHERNKGYHSDDVLDAISKGLSREADTFTGCFCER